MVSGAPHLDSNSYFGQSMYFLRGPFFRKENIKDPFSFKGGKPSPETKTLKTHSVLKGGSLPKRKHAYSVLKRGHLSNLPQSTKCEVPDVCVTYVHKAQYRHEGHVALYIS